MQPTHNFPSIYSQDKIVGSQARRTSGAFPINTLNYVMESVVIRIAIEDILSSENESVAMRTAFDGDCTRAWGRRVLWSPTGGDIAY